jgi:hypothetical protein
MPLHALFRLVDGFFACVDFDVLFNIKAKVKELDPKDLTITADIIYIGTA